MASPPGPTQLLPVHLRTAACPLGHASPNPAIARFGHAAAGDARGCRTRGNPLRPPMAPTRRHCRPLRPDAVLRQVARRLGHPPKFSDRLAYSHRIDPLKSWVIEHRKQFRTLRDQQWRRRPHHPTIHGFPRPSSQQTATFSETRRPVRTPTDLAQPRSGPSVPPLPTGTDSEQAVVSVGYRGMWRNPSECGGGVALRVLYLAEMMSWCWITESERFVPPTILRRCLLPRLVSSNGCRGGGCPMLSTSWGDRFGRRHRDAATHAQPAGYRHTEPILSPRDAGQPHRAHPGSRSTPGSSGITWWRWTLTPRWSGSCPSRFGCAGRLRAASGAVISGFSGALGRRRGDGARFAAPAADRRA